MAQHPFTINTHPSSPAQFSPAASDSEYQLCHYKLHSQAKPRTGSLSFPSALNCIADYRCSTRSGRRPKDYVPQ